MKRLKKALIIHLCLIFVFSTNAVAISIPDEQKLGDKYMQHIKDQRRIIHDPVVHRMMNIVGMHIISVLPPQPFEFTYNLINDDSFNAFASPAANIFIHWGLIAALDTMDEFAGIMAHEIAHSASRHVSESIDRSKLISLGSMAGMLAGVLIGAAGENGDAAQALTLGSVAAGQSAMLSFTRENETEADQKAVLFMNQTGYRPEGLLSALNKIREADYQGMENIPDYFKTHPGTGERIAHLAGILGDDTPPANKLPAPENYAFQMVKYRVIGLYSDPGIYIDKLEVLVEKDPKNKALNYGLGLLYMRTSRLDEARTRINTALAQDPFDPMVLMALARLNIRSGNFNAAISVLKGVIPDEVLGDTGLYYRSVAQIETGDIDASESGLYRIIAKNLPGFEKANYHMANIMTRRGNTPLASYYLGVYYADTGNVNNATHHLKKAIKTLKNKVLLQNAEDKLRQLREKNSKTRRRHFIPNFSTTPLHR
ncbi:MAG: Zn-dependent protease [Desulfobacterales bacterium]|nr:MAG: Zn-dependent protease [Desulfobacterales bacterium]